VPVSWEMALKIGFDTSSDGIYDWEGIREQYRKNLS
jgi:DUF971 family protein